MDVVHLLGAGVIRLQFLIGDRPGRGDAVMMAQLAEVLPAQTIERRAEHLGRPADEIMYLRLKRPAVAVVPGLGGDIAVLHEHRRRIPVLRLALEPIAALENQDALSRGRELSGERAAACAAADDDDVKALVHACSISEKSSLFRRGSYDQTNIRAKAGFTPTRSGATGRHCCA
jgi:hypothetical protein